jgi:hypothetical protein
MLKGRRSVGDVDLGLVGVQHGGIHPAIADGERTPVYHIRELAVQPCI